jgi:hypothetical protein
MEEADDFVRAKAAVPEVSSRIATTTALVA